MLKEVLKNIPKRYTIGLVVLLLGLIALEVAMTCAIPLWRDYFYDILQLKLADQFHTSLTYFLLLMTGLGLAQGLKAWVGQLISFEVRKSATDLLFSKWSKAPKASTNYTQAMTESLRNSTELYLEIVVEIIISLSIVVVLIFASLHQPLIIVAALIYTAVASLAAMLFNKPLVRSDKDWQSEEGAFRESLVELANKNSKARPLDSLVNVVRSYYVYIRIVMYFTLFTRMKSTIASLIPYMLLAGSFFTGAITLGDFMAGVAAFELLVINATILLILYPKLTKARASYQISQEFYNGLRSRK
jgi:putative ATP-binding cassette transporter